MLADLNLKLIRVTSVAAGPPVAVPTLAPSPSPGEHSAVTDAASTLGSLGLNTAPSGLIASVAEEYNSDDNFCWDGDESGLEFSLPHDLPTSRKSNNLVAPYNPFCLHTVVESLHPSLHTLPVPPLPVASSATRIVLSQHLTSIIECMSTASILPTLGSRFTVADSGATDHIFPDKLAFISYKLVSNLQVCMGNNSFLPVLGCCTAIILLNG
jgi:hypothetical protein